MGDGDNVPPVFVSSDAGRPEYLEAATEVTEFSRDRTNSLRFSPSLTMFSNLRISAGDKICCGPDPLPVAGLLFSASSSQKDGSSGLRQTDDRFTGMAV